MRKKTSYLSLEALAIGAHWFEKAMVFVPVSKRIFIMTVGVLTIAQSLVIAAHADDRNQFFESNAVDNFTVPVVEKQGFGYQYFIDTAARKKAGEDPQEKEEAKQLAAQAAPAAQSPTNQPTKFESADDVLGAYGDPSEETPVLAQDNAPKPFKAMMAAFQVGDEKLAYGYARQWVRYMDDLRARTTNVLKATEAAQKSEDLVSSNIPGAEQLKQGLVNENANLAANLDPRAQEILAKARADEAARTKNVPADSAEAKEMKARQEIRRALAGKIPVDPKGRVDVYIFFSPTDKNASAFVPVANKIYDRLSSVKGANFAGFSSARLTKEALSRQRKEFGLSFDLMVGDSFAKELQLRQFPAVVFVSPTTGKIIREVGDKPFIFYDELIAAIQGRSL